MKIRAATEADREAIWKIFHEIVVAGDTYALDPKISRQAALAYWFRAGTHAYVAEKDGHVDGTYILHPNQSGGGSHVANAAFMVASDAQGAGFGRRMGEHCLIEARRLGFRAMQFNLWFPQTPPQFAFGSNLASQSSAQCRVRFAIRKKDMSMFM